MAFDPATIPYELIRQIRARDCGLFAGAGLSIGAGLPDWKGLVERMLAWCEREKISLPVQPQVVREMILKDQLLDVAQTLREAMGEQCFGEFIIETFSATHIRPTANHLILPEIPFAAILTTNFDKLIEDAFASRNGKVPPVYNSQDIAAMARSPGVRKPYIFKVHGDVDRPETIVLGRKDYYQMLNGNIPFNNFFTSLWQTKTLLFVGVSFQDLDTTLRAGLITAGFEGFGRRHFALMPADPAMPVWRERLRLDHGIHAIPYDCSDGHAEVGEFLRGLKSLASSQQTRNRKLPPVIKTATAQSYASAYMAVIILSEAARRRKRVPDDVRVQLAGLPGLRIDFDSFGRDGYDVIFRMWLQGIDKRENEIWVRAGTAVTLGEAKTLEQKLLRAVADLSGGSASLPPEAPSHPESIGDRAELRDGTRRDLLITRLGWRSLAVFAESRARAIPVGRISVRANFTERYGWVAFLVITLLSVFVAILSFRSRRNEAAPSALPTILPLIVISNGVLQIDMGDKRKGVPELRLFDIKEAIIRM